MIVLVITFSKFYAHELVLGQVNILFAVIATGALLSIKAGREAIAGALIALAIVIKPYAVLFLPWLVARGGFRRRRPRAEGWRSPWRCRSRSTASPTTSPCIASGGER